MKLKRERDDNSTTVDQASPDLLQVLLQQTSDRSVARGSHLVGDLVGFDTETGAPLVRRREGETVAARSVVDLDDSHVGCKVVVVWEDDDPNRPIVLGVLREGVRARQGRAALCIDVEADGQRVVISASDRIVLRCGKSSITLTSSGKVLIEGEYLSTRATGVHRIKGGSVQIN